MKIESQRDFGRRECPSCACEVAANHNHCPICGYAFPNRGRGARAFRWTGAILMLAILLFMLLAGLFR